MEQLRFITCTSVVVGCFDILIEKEFFEIEKKKLVKNNLESNSVDSNKKMKN